jgi:hypothetical protein
MMRAIRWASTATLVILALCSCSKKKGETTEATASATPGGGTTSATPTTGPDLVSDLIVARQGSDFRLLREAAPPKR